MVVGPSSLGATRLTFYAVSGYGQFCPVSKAAEVICQRWTPLILRELLVGSTHFNEIRRGVPTCSPALLSKRLKELEAAGVITRLSNDQGTSYNLTESGRELFPLIQGLGEWGQRWVRSDYQPEDLDPGLLLWDVRRFLAPGGIASGRVVVQLTFPSMPAKRRYFWVVVDDQDVDLCLTDPGFEVDVLIEADLPTLTRVWMGDARFVDALGDGRITMRGPTKLTRRIPDWFGQHPVLAGVARGH
jgi:DNA-binding HxlR family transcriptional regulator